MDILTAELKDFLTFLALHPDKISHRVEHYIEHILELLSVEDEEMIKSFFGIFGKNQMTINDLARKRGKTEDETTDDIRQCLHKLAITPEWQAVKSAINWEKDNNGQEQ